MPYRETVNAKGLRLDAMRISVVDSRVATTNGPRYGSDIVVLMGFMPGDQSLYSALPVSSVDQVIDDLVGFDNEVALESFRKSEIFKALLSCRMNGGTDIVLFKLGDLGELDGMSEDDRMQLLYDRLSEGLPIAADNEWYAYLVPVEAPAEGYTKSDDAFLDFMALVADACAGAMSTGLFMQSLLSTRETDGTIWVTSESLRRKEAWQFRGLDDGTPPFCYSPTLGWIPGNDKYRFVAVPTGRALFSSYEHNAFFEHGLAPALAGLLSSLPTDVSATGRTLKLSEIRGSVLGSTADAISVAGYMPVGQSALMRRRKMEGAIVLGDNTMAVPASDYKQEVVLRLARRVSLKMRLALDPLIGTNGSMVDDIVQKTMDELVSAGTIRSYIYRMRRHPEDMHKVQLYLEIRPYLPVKAIEISIVTGPFV